MNLKSSLFTLSLLIFGAYYILRHDEVPFLAKSIDTNQIDVQYQFSMPPTSNVIYREVFSFTTDSAAGGPQALAQGWEGYRNGATSNSFQIFKNTLPALPPPHMVDIISLCQGDILS